MKKNLFRMTAGLSLLVMLFVVGVFVASPLFSDPVSSFAGLGFASFLPMGVFLDPGTGGAGGGGSAEDKLLEKVKTQVTDLIKKSEGDVETKLKALSDQLSKMTNDEELSKIKSQLEELGLSVKSLKEEPKAEKRSGNMADVFVEGYKSLFTKEGKPSAELEGIIKRKGSKQIAMELKSAGTMTTGNVTPTVVNAVPFTLADFEASLTRLVRRVPFIRDIVNMGRTNNNVVAYVEQRNADPGSAGMTAEGSAKTQTDFDLVESKKDVEKVTAYIKVSREMLADIPFIESEIRNELVELIELKADSQILTGDGSSPNLDGILNHNILQFVTAVTGSSFENTIDEANRFDVLRVAIALIRGQASNGPFEPTDIVMHPNDVALMDLEKGTDGHYVMPPFKTADGTTIKGIRIVENVGMNEGSFLVGDFKKSNVRVREDVMLSVGLENDDFTKNLVTILGEMRLTHYIKNNHLNAFVEGTFTDAIEILDPALPT